MIRRTGLLAIGTLLLGLAQTAIAGPVVYFAHLSGLAEAPPNASPGDGIAYVTIDSTLHTMTVDVVFSGLLGGVTASHIHAATDVAGVGTAPVATQTPTFVGFPSGVTSGSYLHTFDTLAADTYRAGFITANGGTAATAEAALFAAIADGKAYLNIHTTVVPGGEIRGFLTPVPEPSTIASAVIGVVLLAGTVRARRDARVQK